MAWREIRAPPAKDGAEEAFHVRREFLADLIWWSDRRGTVPYRRVDELGEERVLPQHEEMHGPIENNTKSDLKLSNRGWQLQEHRKEADAHPSYIRRGRHTRALLSDWIIAQSQMSIAIFYCDVEERRESTETGTSECLPI